jgi:hypothetical protein
MKRTLARAFFCFAQCSDQQSPKGLSSVAPAISRQFAEGSLGKA